MFKRAIRNRLLPCLVIGFLLAALAAGFGSKVPFGTSAHAETASDGSHVELLFTYGSEKEEWIKDVTAAFNNSERKVAGKVVSVNAVPIGSGECIEEVLHGTRKPHLISPASAAFIQLGNAKSKKIKGGDLVGP